MTGEPSIMKTFSRRCDINHQGLPSIRKRCHINHQGSRQQAAVNRMNILAAGSIPTFTLISTFWQKSARFGRNNLPRILALASRYVRNKLPRTCRVPSPQPHVRPKIHASRSRKTHLYRFSDTQLLSHHSTAAGPQDISCPSFQQTYAVFEGAISTNGTPLGSIISSLRVANPQ